MGQSNYGAKRLPPEFESWRGHICFINNNNNNNNNNNMRYLYSALFS